MSGQTLQATEFEPVLEAREAADLLHIHVNTLRLWARQNKVPCHRLGRLLRFRRSELNTLFPYTGIAVRAAQPERTAAA